MIAIKRMLHLQTCLLFLISFALIKEGVCQTEKLFTPPSPQSQEFIKYGNYPVSYFTGVPDISIPLHQVNFYGYSIPFTLKYHPSGVKVGSHVDAVGIGWTLFCGGEISRTVNSVPDESWAFKKGILSGPVNSSYYRYLKDMTEGYPNGIETGDMGYDEFNVTLPNGTFFKFYISNEAGVYKINTNPAPLPVQITFDYPFNRGLGATINSFTIIDQQGVKYYFANAEYATCKFGWRFKNSWKLTTITLPNTDKTINFTYKSTNDVIVPKKNYSRVIRDSVGHITCGGCMFSGDNNCFYGLPAGDQTSWVVNDYSINNLNFDFGVLIPQSILFGDYSIVFNYNEVRPVGGAILVHKLNNIVLNDVNKRVVFTASDADGTGAITLLEQLTIQDQQQQTQPLIYKFGYTNRGISDNLYYDHWGYLIPGHNINERNEWYFNCNTVNPPMATYNLPNFETAVAKPVNSTDECLFDTWVDGRLVTHYKTLIGNATREPYNVPQITLNSIAYPTGGYTVFEYESNVYLDAEGNTPGTTRSAGGYRIKSISSYANGTLSERKTYKYGVNECGYGYTPIQPSAKSYQKTYIDWEDWRPPSNWAAFGPEARYRERNFSSDNFTNLLGNMPPIMYEEVAEYVGDANSNTGKTIYRYNIMKRVPVEEGGYMSDYLQTNRITGDYYVMLDDQWRYGQLQSKEVYKNEHNTYTLIQKQEQQWDYSAVVGLNDYSNFYMYDRAIWSTGPDKFEFGMYTGCFGEHAFQYNPHYIYTGKAVISRSTVTDYTGSGSITNDDFYSYDGYGQLAEKTTTNSKGTTYKTEYKYPYSAGILNESLSADNIIALNALITKNIVAPAIQETKYFGLNGVTTKRTDYLLFNNKPLPQSIKLKTDALAIEENAVYTRYDNDGNPLQYTGIDGIVTSLLWGYKGQYLVAKITGVDYNTASGRINQAVIDNPSNDQVLRNELNNLRSIPNALITTYTCKPAIGISSMTDPNGKTAYYEYDGLGRLEVIKDQDGNIIKTFRYQYKQ